MHRVIGSVGFHRHDAGAPSHEAFVERGFDSGDAAFRDGLGLVELRTRRAMTTFSPAWTESSISRT